jgi:hypothetical protein
MYWDARYALGNKGIYVAAFWTYDRQQQRDANIHLSYSADGGRRWSAPRDTGIIGQVCHPVLLDDGKLLLVYVDRYLTHTIRAVLSDDMGQSFRDEVVIYEHPTADGRNGRSSKAMTNYLQEMDIWTFGRVDAVKAPDGQVMIVYYAGTRDATNIHWAQLETRSDVNRLDESGSEHGLHRARRAKQLRSTSN